jgi:hypothetical protein
MQVERHTVTRGGKHTAIGAGLFVVVGLASVVTLLVLLNSDARPGQRLGVRELFGFAIEAFRAQKELRDGSDIVVDRQPSGTLVVSGRALESKLYLSTPQELRALLHSLPSPGVAMVTIAYDRSAGGVQGLVAPAPGEARRAERDLWAVLEAAGFHPARGSVKPLLPLLASPPRDGAGEALAR